MTGTLIRFGQIEAGDSFEVSIDGMGKLTNRITMCTMRDPLAGPRCDCTADSTFRVEEVIELSWRGARTG